MKIKTAFITVTPESAEYGDYDETGWHDEAGVTFASAQEAAEWLLQNANSYCSSEFHPHSWYCSEPKMDQNTGVTTEYSFHLVDCTPEQAQEVYNLWKKGLR